MSRSLPKKNNPLILADVAPQYDELLQRRRLGKTNLSVRPGQIGTSNATKPENLGLFEYAHLRAPLPKDLKGSEIFPSHTAQQHPETYFLMRRSKDGFVSATGMFKIAFPWAKADEERAEREYLKSREYTSQEEVAGNVWISPMFALELSREYKMYDWVRALLDPTDIVQSPSSAKKQITPPPKFELPSEESSTSQRGRSRRSVSPSKKSTSPRKPRQARSTKDAPATPSTSAANDSLQQALEVTASTVETDLSNGIVETVEETEVKTSGSPEKKTKGRKSKKAIAEAEAAAAEAEAEEYAALEEEDTKAEKEEKKAKEEKKEEKKTEKKKKDAKAKEAAASADATEKAKATISLDVPLVPEVPSAAETQEMIEKAKEMVEDAVKAQQTDGAQPGPSAKATKKRKPVEDEDEETSAESAQRSKKARVLEDKIKRERVRTHAMIGGAAALAFAASLNFFF